ncbi:DUF1642 domain-containing protein [Lacticaseibacillus parakribbianus]|uniref:DUF1642 domain-containing protein n=1 Tax=Lacticaseibacillus parakribbianus TaxID=2970927 RepID=UPI0021CB7C2D|nr:DUF1642 domain-containing protein [Lacticaseibacillus parakribbianus]
MSLWAVKNDKGEYAHIDMDELTWETGFATLWFGVNEPYAKRTASDYGGHVVELIEAPAKVVVSAEEAEMLETAKNPTFRPSSVITSYSNDHHGWDLTSDLEDRLMRAYVLGWTVEKPKRWNVKVPHVDGAYYMKLRNGKLSANSVFGNKDHIQQFTDAEI